MGLKLHFTIGPVLPATRLLSSFLKVLQLPVLAILLDLIYALYD